MHEVVLNFLMAPHVLSKTCSLQYIHVLFPVLAATELLTRRDCSCSLTNSGRSLDRMTVAVWLSYICMLFACTWVGLLSSRVGLL